MKTIIAGSRHMLNDQNLISKAVMASGFTITEVVYGLARGADTWGKLWAITHNIPVTEFLADWDTFGKSAGYLRNKQMQKYADAAIIFIWNNSKGSENMRKQMINANKPCFIVYNGVLPTQ